MALSKDQDPAALALALDEDFRRLLDQEEAGYRANPAEGMSEEEFHQAARALRERFAAARRDRR